ncbi:MAG: flavodoxin domain-containing protein [Coriobacteriia bacterium]|nr:flavodoxin domain-containing protein [Coriobacteriia bacterium]
MKAIVVYESLWGNTAEVARAIAEGIGPDALVLSTADATPDAVKDANLLVAGAPAHIRNLPSDKTRATAKQRSDEDQSLPAPDLSHPSMRSWLESLPRGTGRGAAFDTGAAGWWGGGAAKPISRKLRSRGYKPAGKPQTYIVLGQDGPMAEGEIDRARAWGRELAQSLG